jgi:hypothetical protein
VLDAHGASVRPGPLVLAALAVLALPAATAAGLSAVAGPPGALLRTAPLELSPGPPNGDLRQGLAGWSVQGREAPEPQARGVRLRGNTTLVSPPFPVPAGAQALAIAARAAAPALVEVRARPVDGGPEIALGALEPGPATRPLAVAAAPVAGRAVRVVLDPVPALGASLDVLRVGPVTAPLPGWTAARGAPQVAGRRGRRLLRAAEPLELVSPAFAPGPGARALLVAVRGDGVLRAAAGGRRVAARAGSAWRDVAVPVAARAGRVTLRLEVRPDGGEMELRDLGIVRRATRAVGLRARRAGAGSRVAARLVPAGGRLRVELRDARGRRLARGRSDAGGRLRLSARGRPRGGRLVLVVPGDRTRIGLRAVLRIPGA